MSKVTGILGGTFDPVHNAHIKIALELKQQLGLEDMRLMPCALPPHRDTPGATAGQRLAMLQLACENTGLQIDDCELHRDEPSWTVTTLQWMRRQLPPQHSLVFCIGSDAFNGLHQWHEWRELFNLAHLVVAMRPDSAINTSPEVEQELEKRVTADGNKLEQQPAGCIYLAKVSQIPVSSTLVRKNLAEGKSIDNLVPGNVVHYINEHGLYRQTGPVR